MRSKSSIPGFSFDKKVYGDQHPNVATDLVNIGSAWYHLEKYDKALEYFEKALPILRATLPEDHPHIASIRRRIAYRKQKLSLPTE